MASIVAALLAAEASVGAAVAAPVIAPVPGCSASLQPDRVLHMTTQMPSVAQGLPCDAPWLL